MERRLPRLPDEATCVANGGQWGMFFRGDPGRCRCPTQDGGCPCQADGQCSQSATCPSRTGVLGAAGALLRVRCSRRASCDSGLSQACP
ncbi:MAG: hypothetical protein R3F60_32915 [bacterium]